ncbi:MAG: trimeric intracellular cation channel family protein [Bacteroidales bacterium]|jgi:uncharacterized membrane protein YeiH|nr:trimeric intracellular cation channel family protein [Bacteroidales bacterium]MDD6357445.1 trimeric intracellular cation channel family protein [Bacteroidales bacterium]
MNITDIFEYLGTFAFAISGIRFAAAKRFDWFGAYVVGFATAIGGGTIRDVLLDTTPFWMNNANYLICTAVALLTVIVFRKYIVKFNRTLFVFDAIGLSFFTIVGMQKSIDFGQPFWVAMIMGVLTGCAGGIMRDVLINDVPIVFKKEIYAMASVFGGIVFYVCWRLGMSLMFAEIAGAVAVFALRVYSVMKNIDLPQMKEEEHDE